ncbi:NADH dehydrogenase [ubiquinone] 1 alpha subcomplex assembly factor 2 [Latimeria chalumnae]|uniref:NADH:ubiquinone oxidoreductase complex assembly factor 2 n=1 Tax=Latimeria chalumnae TaxID=7897 RepID=H3AWC1_LATCH|nr:PREDICTED: mimitin, mitochondrial [Latimeria chalumnae]|eukprot:XP_005990757.1 PREDICTED: mimitin, mitochondrial [Latimeria chalumnae]
MNKIRDLVQRAFGVVKHHIGTDHLGNKYYYIPQQKTWTGQTIRARRTVEVANLKEYEYEVGDIPSEWDAWIRGKRKEPPTIEEILRNEKYKEVIKIKALAAEEKDRHLQAKEYEEGLVAQPAQTQIKGHASAHYFGKDEPSKDPSSTGKAFQPGTWTPPTGGNSQKA